MKVNFSFVCRHFLWKYPTKHRFWLIISTSTAEFFLSMWLILFADVTRNVLMKILLFDARLFKHEAVDENTRTDDTGTWRTRDIRLQHKGSIENH